MGRLGLPLAFNETREYPGPDVVFSGTVGGKERQWMGRITRTGATVSSQTRLISAIGELRDPYGTGASDGAPMAPGLFVNARIKGETKKGLIWAPRAALRSNDRVFVGLPEEGTLKINDVDVVYSDPSGIYLSGGVDVGDLVIVSPIQAAFEGMNLEVYERTPDGELIPPPERETSEDTEEAIVAKSDSDSEEDIQ